MYRFNFNELSKLIKSFASLFDYNYAVTLSTVPEGKALTIEYYNSLYRKPFTVKLSYDESTTLDYIADIIINNYKERLK